MPNKFGKIEESLDILVEYGYLDDPNIPYHRALNIAINDFSNDETLGGDENREILEILQKEAKKELKLRRKKIDVSKFFGKEENQTTTEADSIGTSSLAVRSKTGKIDTKKFIPEPIDKNQEGGASGPVKDILSSVISIEETLNSQYQLQLEAAKDQKKEDEEKKRGLREKMLEGSGKIWDGIKEAGNKIIEPFKNIWDKILGFISTIFFGRVFYKILEWFGNKENGSKIESIIKFFKDWWPTLLTAYLLFGNAFGRMAVKLGVTVGKFAIKLVTKLIPKMLAGLAKLKAGALLKGGLVLGGVALVTGAVLGAKALDGDFDKDKKRTDEEKEADKEKADSAMDMGTLSMNKGGTVPGSGNTDTVPAMLTPGEFVMSKGAVQQYGASTLAGMNAAAGGTNKPTLMGGYNEGGFANITNTDTTTDPSNPFSVGKRYVAPGEAKERLAAQGMPSMELMDGTVVPNFGKMGVDSFNQGIEMVREGMANNPEKLKELDNFLDTNPYAQPDELQRVINSVVPGSQEQVMSDIGASITASARMNGGGLVQAFQGGGRVQRGRSAAKRRMEASKITPIKKKKVTVAYAEEKQNMADKPNTGKSGQEIPSFNVTAMRSPEKIKLLGISV